MEDYGTAKRVGRYPEFPDPIPAFSSSSNTASPCTVHELYKTEESKHNAPHRITTANTVCLNR